MFRFHTVTLVWLTLFALTCPTGSSAWAEDAGIVGGANGTGQLTTALDELDRWIGDGPNGDRWRKHLDTRQLRDQVAEGSNADPAVVARVLQRYRSGTPGLEKGRFVSVRDALADWLDALQQQFTGDLSKLAWASRGDHQPFSDEQLKSLRGELRNSAQSLEQTLLGYGPEFAANWKRYLHWEQLEPQLADEAKIDRSTLADLGRALKRFRMNKPGLEQPVFTRVAKAIERFRAIAPWAVAAKVRDPRQDYDRLITGLGAQLQRHQQSATSETAWKIGRVLDLIVQMQQSPQLVRAFREKYVRTNLLAEISQSFIDRVAQRPVDNTQCVEDCILGTSIRGTANTVGSISISSIPSPSEIQLDVQLTGHILSSTRGYHKPVRILSTSNTDFVATKRVLISDDAFMAIPSTATADTRSTIHSIRKTGGNFGHQLIEKIAWKKACESKRLAEQTASRHAENRIEAQFDTQLAEMLTESRQKYEQQFRAPLVRRDAYPEHLRMASGARGVRIETAFATGGQFAADSSPPPIADGCDLTLRIHQSAVNNFIPLIMAGVAIRQETEDQPPKLTGDLPPWMTKLSLGKKSADSPDAGAGANENQNQAETSDDAADGEKYEFQPWSITLNNEQPVSATFDDGQLALRMRASRLTSDGSEYQNWDFIVTYGVEQQGNEILLRRRGRIEVFPTGFDPRWDKKMSSKKAGFRSTLAKNMNARAERGESFPAEIPIQAIHLPGNLNVPGELVLRQLQCDNGWLALGWALP